MEKKNMNVSAEKNKKKKKLNATNEIYAESKWIYSAHGEIKRFYPSGMAYEKRYVNWIIQKHEPKRFACHFA